MKLKNKFTNSVKELNSVKSLTTAGMLLALLVVLGYFSNFTLTIFPLVKVGFNPLPQSVAAMMLGPVLSTAICGLGDLISFFLNPQGGAFFPGWTINAALTGLIYGVFLYKNVPTLKNIVIARLLIYLLIEVPLGTLWLNIQFGLPFAETLITRAVGNILTAPFEVALIFILCNTLIKIIPKSKR